VKGKCVSTCNPPCAKGEECTGDARCEAVAAPAAHTSSATGAFVATKDKALVVFVQDKGARQNHVPVFDEQPRFLTVLENPQRHVTAVVKPGKHTFYFGDIVRAEFAAGAYAHRSNTRGAVDVGLARYGGASVAQHRRLCGVSSVDSQHPARISQFGEAKRAMRVPIGAALSSPPS